jgi:hypothetical protein
LRQTIVVRGEPNPKPQIVLTGIGVASAPVRIMREFGAVGDNHIEFRKLRDNRDEHVALHLLGPFEPWLPRNECGETAGVEQTDEFTWTMIECLTMSEVQFGALLSELSKERMC